MLGWMMHKLESRLLGEISITSNDTTLMVLKQRRTKSRLMKVKVESEKVGLNLHIQKTKIMASSPIISWQIDRKQWKQWQTFFFLGGAGGSKTIADGDCSHKIKRCFLLGRKAMTKPDRILKSEDITLPMVHPKLWFFQ